MALTSISVIFYTHRQFIDEFSAIVDEQVDVIVEGVSRRVFSFLEPIQEVTQATSWMIDLPEQIINEKRSIISHLLGLLDAFPQIESFTIGTQEGSSLTATRVSGNSVYRFNPDKFLPANVAYRATLVNRQHGSIKEIDEYYEAQGDLIDSEENRSVSTPHSNSTVIYDARLRPWYQGVQKTQQVFWSDLYLYSNSAEIGISIACPIYSTTGVFIGATAADLNINELSNFLKVQSTGPIAKVFIFNKEGELAAYPDIMEILKIKSSGLEMTRLDTLSDFNLKKVYQDYLKRDYQKKFIFEANSNLFKDIAYFVKFPDSFHKDWTLGIVILGDKFLGNIKQIQKDTLIFCITMLILALFLMVFISRKISRPIEEVANDLKRIQNLDFDQKLYLKSQFSEISDMLEALKNVVTVLRSFGKFVPKTLVQQLVLAGRGAQLGGEQKVLSVMFCDIQSFTTISEKLHSEQLLLHLSDYFEEMTNIIKKNHGTLDKYIGDSIMAFWGAPLPDAQHAYRACHGVLACMNRLNTLNETWEKQAKPPMLTRFGISTGQMLVGNMGSSDRLQYTVLGDVVNLASRLEQLNKEYGTRILVSESTYLPIQDLFIFRPIDRVAVKGKENGVQIYELLSEILETATYPVPPFVELSWLTTEAYEAYCKGNWEKALKCYRKILEAFPDDFLSQVFIKRCTQFIDNPPPEDWDFITRFGGG
ncbi:MAG: adenylate/guanylate cyclase domain-containing protein [Alphaproteobacteria bacterium]